MYQKPYRLMKHPTIVQILAEKDKPVVAIDNHGIITFVNDAFEAAYGWSAVELQGQIITVIMPPHMRDAHNFGFSRFLISQQPRILSTPLSLPVHCKDGSVVDAEHFIVGEKSDADWRFAATIVPKPKEA